MIPKACKSQFRTPFRGRPIKVRSPLSGPHSPDPSLADTPSAVLACSQFSTPGITIDAIKTITRRSPLRTSTTRKKVIRPSKKCQPNKSATAILHREQSKRNESKDRKAEEEENTGGRKYSENKPKNIRSATKITDVGDHDDDVPTVLDDMGNQRFESDDNRQTLNGKKCLSDYTPTEREGPRTGHTRRTKVRVNKRSSVQKILMKCQPTNFTATVVSSAHVQDGDEVVMVDKNAFVYEEHFEEPEEVPAVSKLDQRCDIYNYIPDSPDEHLESKRARKEQVRLQVLKNIYQIETELAVFRHRRHKLRAKFMKGLTVGN